jgi:hypothetical protein
MVSYVVLSIEFSSLHLHMMDDYIFRTDLLRSIETLDASHPITVLSHQATLSILGGSETCLKMIPVSICRGFYTGCKFKRVHFTWGCRRYVVYIRGFARLNVELRIFTRVSTPRIYVAYLRGF